MPFGEPDIFSNTKLILALIVFPVVLVIYMFSSCDVRKRSAKRACKAGDV